jgi:hypothetical protein
VRAHPISVNLPQCRARLVWEMGVTIDLSAGGVLVQRVHTENDMRKMGMLVIGLLAAFGVTAARAEDVKIEAPLPEPRIIAPGLLYETKPRDENYFPGPSVPYDPAFISPLTTPFESAHSSGRLGASGWTAPYTPVGPVGPGQHGGSGWLSFGFTWTWGGPLTPSHGSSAR